MSNKKTKPRKSVAIVSGVELSMQCDLQEKVHKTFVERMGGRSVITSLNQAHNLTGGEKGRANEKRKKDPASSLQQKDGANPPDRTPLPVPPIPPLRSQPSSSSISNTCALGVTQGMAAPSGDSPSHNLQKKSKTMPYSSHTSISGGKAKNQKTNLQPAIPPAFVQRSTPETTSIPLTKKKNRLSAGAPTKKSSAASTGTQMYASPLPMHVTPMAKIAQVARNAIVDQSTTIRHPEKSTKKRPKEPSQSSLVPTPPSKKKSCGPSSTDSNTFKTPLPPKKKSAKPSSAKTAANPQPDEVLRNINNAEQTSTEANATSSKDTSSKAFKFRTAINPLLKHSSSGSRSRSEARSSNLECTTRKRHHSITPSSSDMEPSAKRVHTEGALPLVGIVTENSTSVTPIHQLNVTQKNRFNWSKELLSQRNTVFDTKEARLKYLKMVMDEMTMPHQAIPVKESQQEVSPEKWDKAYYESRMPTTEDVLDVRGYAESSALVDIALKATREKAVILLDHEHKSELMKRKRKMLWLDERGPDDPPKDFLCACCGGSWMKVMELRRTNKETGTKETVRSLVCRDICCMVIMKQNVALEAGRLFGRPKQAEMQFRRSRADLNCSSKSSKRLAEYLSDLEHYTLYARDNKIDESSDGGMYIQIPGQQMPVCVL